MASIYFAEQSKLRRSQMISFLSHHDDDGYCLKGIRRAVTTEYVSAPHILFKFWSSARSYFFKVFVLSDTLRCSLNIGGGLEKHVQCSYKINSWCVVSRLTDRWSEHGAGL